MRGRANDTQTVFTLLAYIITEKSIAKLDGTFTHIIDNLRKGA